MRTTQRTAPLLMWLGALPVAAQTTPTEREAAGPVVAQVEALQADIRPTELAQRLTLFDVLVDDDFRETVSREHAAMAALFNDHVDGLRRANEPELGVAAGTY